LQICRNIIKASSDLFRAYDFEPRHRGLVAALVGNGKTSLSEAIAEELKVLLLSVG
jgi:SpoVK/Ycf46/Vps4 family AAA+-type ATPase